MQVALVRSAAAAKRRRRSGLVLNVLDYLGAVTQANFLSGTADAGPIIRSALAAAGALASPSRKVTVLLPAGLAMRVATAKSGEARNLALRVPANCELVGQSSTTTRLNFEAALAPSFAGVYADDCTAPGVRRLSLRTVSDVQAAGSSGVLFWNTVNAVVEDVQVENSGFSWGVFVTGGSTAPQITRLTVLGTWNHNLEINTTINAIVEAPDLRNAGKSGAGHNIELYYINVGQRQANTLIRNGTLTGSPSGNIGCYGDTGTLVEDMVFSGVTASSSIYLATDGGGVYSEAGTFRRITIQTDAGGIATTTGANGHTFEDITIDAGGGYSVYVQSNSNTFDNIEVTNPRLKAGGLMQVMGNSNTFENLSVHQVANNPANPFMRVIGCSGDNNNFGLVHATDNRTPQEMVVVMEWQAGAENNHVETITGNVPTAVANVSGNATNTGPV